MACRMHVVVFLCLGTGLWSKGKPAELSYALVLSAWEVIRLKLPGNTL